MTFNRFVLLSAVCCSFAALPACNRTEGECYPRGEGASGAGAGDVGGGIITPTGAGGFGEAPPEPQDLDDEEEADPCNATQGPGQTFTCNGDILCSKDIAAGTATTGCHFVLKRFTSTSAEKLVEDLRKKCELDNPGYACKSDELTCSNTPPKKYVCNGGIACADDKGNQSGCTVGGEPTDPYSSLFGDVYAFDESDARDHLADLCEVLKHDKYGNNCSHGGMCCIPSSVTCHTAP